MSDGDRSTELPIHVGFVASKKSRFKTETKRKICQLLEPIAELMSARVKANLSKICYWRQRQTCWGKTEFADISFIMLV